MGDNAVVFHGIGRRAVAKRDGGTVACSCIADNAVSDLKYAVIKDVVTVTDGVRAVALLFDGDHGIIDVKMTVGNIVNTERTPVL